MLHIAASLLKNLFKHTDNNQQPLALFPSSSGHWPVKCDVTSKKSALFHRSLSFVSSVWSCLIGRTASFCSDGPYLLADDGPASSRGLWLTSRLTRWKFTCAWRCQEMLASRYLFTNIRIITEATKRHRCPNCMRVVLGCMLETMSASAAGMQSACVIIGRAVNMSARRNLLMFDGKRAAERGM
jgi:hypothetical protein